MDEERYSMRISDMGQQEKDLFECLLRINQGEPLDARAEPLVGRLVEAGLVDSDGATLTLTSAGIRRCQSLQHRLAGDEEAAQVLWARDHAEDPGG